MCTVRERTFNPLIMLPNKRPSREGLNDNYLLPDAKGDQDHEAPHDHKFRPCTRAEAPIGIWWKAEAFTHGPEQRYSPLCQCIGGNMHHRSEQNTKKDQVRGAHHMCRNGKTTLIQQ